MINSVPITAIDGIQLVASDYPGIVQVRVIDRRGLSRLTWDRFVRLRVTADCIKQNRGAGRILDIGGYDGALALFLDGFDIELLDPETTGGTATAIPAKDHSYDVAALVDVLEHIAPHKRCSALKECARVASGHLVLNYPCQASASAQELMLKLTGNPLVKEHVEWPLPDSDWVIKTLEELGFEAEASPHTSVAIWLGQYLVQNLLPNLAPDLNKALIEHHAADPFTVPLYHLVAAVRKQNL